MAHTIFAKNKGSILVNSEQYQVGSFRITYKEDNVRIVAVDGKSFEGNYGAFTNGETGLPFVSLFALKTFISDNFFDEPLDTEGLKIGIGNARFDTDPASPENTAFTRFNAVDKWGTYTHFLDADGDPVVLVESDFTGMQAVQFFTEDNGESWSIEKIALPSAASFVSKSELHSSVEPTKNQLFNKMVYLADTYVNTSGIVVKSLPTTANYRTAQVKVNPALLTISGGGLSTVPGVAHRCSFYNASGVLIAGSYAVINTATFTASIPPTADVFNLTYQHGALDDNTAGDTVMLNYGSPLAYESYESVDVVDGIISKNITARMINDGTKTATIDKFLSTTLLKSEIAQKVGVNLFNKSDYTLLGKILTSSGTGYANETGALTVRIRLAPGQTNIFVDALPVNTLLGSKYYRFLDASGTLVPGSVGLMLTTQKSIAIPGTSLDFEITAYRPSVDGGSISLIDNTMITYGSEAVQFVPYVSLVNTLNGLQVDAYKQPKGIVIPFAPATIYSICNDIVDYGSASEYKYNRNYSTVLYMDRFFNLKSRLFDAKIDGTQNDKYPVSAPYDVTSGSIVYNNGNNYNTETKSFKIVSNTIADINMTFVHKSTKASVLKNKKIALLCLGDSNTDGTRTVLIDTADGKPARFYDAAAYLAEMDRVDAGLPASDYLFKCVGTHNRRDMICTYKGANTNLTAYAEGWPSWSAADFLYRTDHKSQSQGTWDWLGLGNGTGTDFTATTAQLSLLNTTAEGVFTPLNTAAFISYANELYGGITTYAQALAKATDMLSNPKNPFFDKDKAGTNRFSFSKYMDRYKTLADDGVTRLVVGSTAGTNVTDATAWDLYKPTHIAINLGTNDFYGTWYLPTMQSIIDEIHSYDSNIIVVIGLMDASGTYFPEFYPHLQNVSLYNNFSFHNKSYIVNKDLMTLQNSGAKVFYDPSYFVQPTAEGAGLRHIPDAADIIGNGTGTDLYSKYGKAPEQHLNSKAHAAKGYELLSLIYYTKQYMV